MVGPNSEAKARSCQFSQKKELGREIEVVGVVGAVFVVGGVGVVGLVGAVLMVAVGVVSGVV